MILQNVRQLVRQKLDDLQYDGNKIDSAINWFLFELFNNTRTTIMEDDTNIPFWQGDYEVTIPPEVQVITELQFRYTDTSIRPYSIWKNRQEHGDFLQKTSQASWWQGRMMCVSGHSTAVRYVLLRHLGLQATCS